MTDQELTAIVNEELRSRPIYAPADVQGYMTVVYRNLRLLPAEEVRLGIRAFYSKPVCEHCGRRAQNWPQPEEITVNIPETVLAKFRPPVNHNPNCSFCDGTGWRRVERGELSGVYRCEA